MQYVFDMCGYCSLIDSLRVSVDLCGLYVACLSNLSIQAVTQPVSMFLFHFVLFLRVGACVCVFGWEKECVCVCLFILEENLISSIYCVLFRYLTMVVSTLGNLTALRTFRVLRALKTVAVIPGEYSHTAEVTGLVFFLLQLSFLSHSYTR